MGPPAPRPPLPLFSGEVFPREPPLLSVRLSALLGLRTLPPTVQTAPECPLLSPRDLPRVSPEKLTERSSASLMTWLGSLLRPQTSGCTASPRTLGDTVLRPLIHVFVDIFLTYMFVETLFFKSNQYLYTGPLLSTRHVYLNQR